MAGEKVQLSPAQKAMLFAQATRQNLQPIPAQAFVDGGSVSFTIPKARLLSRGYVRIYGTFKIAHAATTALTKSRFAPYNLVKQVRMQINNGFNPFQISGRGGYLYDRVITGSEFDSNFTLGSTASVGGTTNTIDMFLDLSTILNDRDPVGLVMAQNQETVITITIDFNTIAGMYTDSATTVTLPAITVTPTVETFSIPAAIDSIPDMSVLKLVNEQNFNIPSTGAPFQIKLPIGLTYRKLLLNFETAAGVGMTDDEIGNISIIFNQADTPYVIHPGLLRMINSRQFRGRLPAGVVAFDFSYQGIANMGGARDYIDTERLTEFWIQANPSVVGNLQVISESLAKLQGV
jgi:hypothetical protein